jgi:hypothetical protein
VQGTNVTVSWVGGLRPQTLQTKAQLTDSDWTDVLTTFANSYSFPPTAQSAFFRLVWRPPPLDTTDYEAARPVVASFYESDPIGYWASYGIPALCRLAEQAVVQGANTNSPFDGLTTAYDESMFMSAYTGGQLPSEFSQRVQSFLAMGQPPSQALLLTFRSFIREMDGATDSRIAQILQMFYNVFPNAFHIDLLSPLAPQPSKAFGSPPPSNQVDWIGLYGDDSFCLTATALQPNPLPDDTDTNRVIRWDRITGIRWQTTYNASCAAQAVGPCAVKLGLYRTNMTCQLWNDLSRALGATPGESGAPHSGISGWFDRNGYGCQRARDGIFESAVDEARKALARGCDVLLRYTSGTNGHVEMVTSIALNPNNSSSATVTTSSWGSNATVTVTGNTYTNKSDGARYGTNSYLNMGGTAYFYMYCRKQ